MTVLQCTTRWLAIGAVLFLAACTKPAATAGDAHEPPMDSLVTAAWLDEHLGDPDLVVIDCTVLVERTADGNVATVSGRARYDTGHIPTAAFADLLTDLSDPDSDLKFAVPSAAAFAAAMGALGVGDESRVVLYDSNGSAWAARVWWMLRWVGFDRAALLDGGLAAWTDAGLPLSTEPAAHTARMLTPNVRPELIVERDEVRAAIGDDGVTLIDALPAAHYSGERSMYGRPGHIPGAVNVPVYSLVDEFGRYRSEDELASLFDGDRDGRTITYCGGGIAASADAFIMTRLGYKNVAVYTASLQEWAADAANPLETD